MIDIPLQTVHMPDWDTQVQTVQCLLLDHCARDLRPYQGERMKLIRLSALD
jgi:hypothetical protein